jgi:hypothetical protein
MFSAAALSDEVPLLNDDVLQTSMLDALRGGRDHQRVNVESKNPADSSLRERDCECAIAATEFDHIPDGLTTAERIEYTSDVEVGFPLLDHGHAAVATLRH